MTSARLKELMDEYKMKDGYKFKEECRRVRTMLNAAFALQSAMLESPDALTDEWCRLNERLTRAREHIRGRLEGMSSVYEYLPDEAYMPLELFLYVFSKCNSYRQAMR